MPLAVPQYSQAQIPVTQQYLPLNINPFQNVPISHNYPISPQLPVPYLKLGTQKTPFGEDVHLYMLSNGQRVAIMPKEGTTIVKTFVNSGSMNEIDEKRGISHFIEHNLFNGSKGLAPGEFFKTISKMGADTNASTDFAQTDYFISQSFLTDKNLEKTVEMHADMILHPLFGEDMIEKEKGPVTSEISMVNDTKSTVAANEVIRNLFQINSTSDNLVAGSIKTVSALSKKDVEEYWRKHYTTDNMYTVLVGDVNPEEAIGLIAKNFNQKPSTADRQSENLIPLQKPKRIDLTSKTDNSSLVLAGFVGPVVSNTRDKIIFEAIGLLLLGSSTSRMSNALKEVGGYGAFDSQKVGLKPQDPQALFLQIATPKNREQQAIDIMYKTLEDFGKNPPTSEEMTTVKNILKKALAMSYESSEAICDMIGTSFLNGDIGAMSHYHGIIDSLTPQDLVGGVEKYLDLNKVSLGVVHAAGTTNEDIQKSFEKSPYSMRITKDSQVSFGSSKPISTKNTEQFVLPDNNHVYLSDTKSDIAYFDWKLTSHSTVAKNLATPYVLSAILNYATKNGAQSSIIKNADLKGIDFNIDSNSFSISAKGNALSKNAVEAIGMLKSSIFSPNLTQEEFESAKTRVKEHFESLNKNPSGGLVAQLYPQYFADVPQILEGLKSVTLNDVKGHWANVLNGSSSNFVMAAPFSKTAGLKEQSLNALALSKGSFKDPQINNVGVYQPTQKTKVLIDTEERNQAQVFKTYSFKMSGNIGDEVKFEILNNILGGSPSSRLFGDLREKEKLAYRVASQVQTFGDTGIVTMYILTTTDDKEQGDIKYDNLKRSLDGFFRHTQKLQNEPVTDEELESAKMILKQAIHQEFEMPETRVQLLAMNAERPFGIKRIDEYYKAIDKITKEDIQSAAKHVFSNKPIISVLASEDTINDQRPYLESLVGENADRKPCRTAGQNAA